jgi:hypothetical protein
MVELNLKLQFLEHLMCQCSAKLLKYKPQKLVRKSTDKLWRYHKLAPQLRSSSAAPLQTDLTDFSIVMINTYT